MMKLVCSVCSDKTTCFQLINHASWALPLFNCVTSLNGGTEMSAFSFDIIYNPISLHNTSFKATMDDLPAGLPQIIKIK